jgi:hypothetical protein
MSMKRKNSLPLEIDNDSGLIIVTREKSRCERVSFNVLVSASFDAEAGRGSEEVREADRASGFVVATKPWPRAVVRLTEAREWAACRGNCDFDQHLKS